ncbi:MAG TPA: hypothetical protein VGI39_12755 [Polyangiaceae bacterium]|jgi:hypothetical protein
MSKLVLGSALGLTGVLIGLAAGAQGCSSSDSGNSTNDAGADTGTNTTPDTGTTTPTDSSTPTDTGTTPPTDTGTVPPPTQDAGPWNPSNFTTAAIANVLTPAPLAVDVNGSCGANTDDGTWTCGNGTISNVPNHIQVTLSGTGGTATLWAMASLTLEAGANLDVTGAKPAIFYVIGDAQINAPITVEAGNQSGGGGVGAPPAADPATATFAPGGGSFCGLGGIGVAISDSGTTGAPGTVNGSANLIPLLGGSAGGGAGNSGGGNGGGALQITATNTIVITSSGSILAAGLGGTSNNGNVYSGAGGSGGAILLESPSVSVAGSLSANGGSGGDANNSGQDGTLGTSQATGGGGGGQGAAGTVVKGGAGTGDGAAGGGGAGYIRINANTANLGSGVISPATGDAGAACTSVGPLAH